MLDVRSDDERGPLLAAAAIVLAVTVYTLVTRFDDDWGTGVQLLVTGAAALAVLAVAIPVDVREGAVPPAWLSALYAAGFALTLGALILLADVLGANGDDPGSGTVTWVSLVLVAAWGYLAVRRNSGISAFLAALAAVTAVVAFVDWVFDPESASTFRYVLTACIVALAAGAVALRDARLDYATALADAAGIAALALAVTFLGDLFLGAIFGAEDEGATDGPAWGWELVLLLTGAALCAFAALHRVAGPGWIGAVVLVVFVLMASEAEDPSLVGWPLVLVLALGLLIAALLRPRDQGPRAVDQTVESRL
jgi:hypothetical protein